MTRTILFAAALATSLSGLPAMAAPDPSVGDVIKALTVSPNRTRGSRPVQAPGTQQPGAQTPAAQVPAAQVPTAQAPGGGTATTGMAQPPAAPVTGEGSGAIDLSVQFAAGSADLTPAARKTLDVLGQALVNAQLVSVRVRIEGHTDTVGTDESNLLLSQRRAAAAAAYLQQRFHIDGTRLESVGRGESEPLVKTGDNINEPRNRRVHVVNISG